MISVFENFFLFLNPSSLIYFYIFPILFGFSMYGWGHIFLLKSLSSYISINIVIGMGTILFIGGILNYFNSAYQSIIIFLFYIGLILFLLKIFTKLHYFKTLKLIKNFKKTYCLYLLPIILLIISIISSINPDAYNYHDDYQKYFVHTIKMLETGSVFGSTLNAIGPQTLGGQAFFQSFFISFLGLNSMNIFDSIFCLSVCIILLLELAIKEREPIFGILIASLIILIHPQFVNVSSLYSAVLFMIASIILTFEFYCKHTIKNLSYLKIILALSFCFASLAVLKTSNVIFLLIYFILFLFFIFFFRNFNKRIFHFIFITPLLSLIFFFSWIFFPFKLFVNSGQSTNQPLDLKIEMFQPEPYFKTLISTKPLFYGGTQLSYTLLTLVGFFFIILVFFLKKKIIVSQKVNNEAVLIGSLSIISGIIIYFLLIIFGEKYYEIPTLTRYSIPFITATIPSGMLLLYTSIPKDLRYYRFTFFLVIIAISLNFFPQYIKRTIQSYECGSQLSFSSFACSEGYINYNKEVLSEDQQFFVQKLQKQIPKNKSIMVWTNTSFLFNFKRNDIIDISIEGFDNPWTKFPSAEYMIWEYKGFATRSIKSLQYTLKTSFLIDKKHAARTIQHIKKINELYKTGKIKLINDNGSFLIFKILY